MRQWYNDKQEQQGNPRQVRGCLDKKIHLAWTKKLRVLGDGMFHEDSTAISVMTKRAGAGDILMAIQSLRHSMPVIGTAGRAASHAGRQAAEKVADSTARMGASALNKGMASENAVVRGLSEHTADSVRKGAESGNFGSEFVAGGLHKGLSSENPLVRKASSFAEGTINSERVRTMAGAENVRMGYGGLPGIDPKLGYVQTAIETGTMPAVNFMTKAVPKSARNLMNSLAMAGHLNRIQPAARAVAHEPVPIVRSISPR